MRFTKMHGCGNDYVYVDCFNQAAPADPARLAVPISDRHTGVGSDGLILVMPPEPGVEADARMRMFNADGSEGQMCGNGIRCVCKLVHDHRLLDGDTPNPLRVQTASGVLSLAYTLDEHARVKQVTVDMGEPIVTPPDIPILEAALDDATRDATHVGMGNPHAVRYVGALDRDAMLREGAALEHHPAYPERMNTHFVAVRSESEVDVLHWERGSGATLACGTGACAVCVAGVLTGRTQRTITTHLPGGDLTIEWRESDGHVYMTGPAVEVFSGEWGSDAWDSGPRV